MKLILTAVLGLFGTAMPAYAQPSTSSVNRFIIPVVFESTQPIPAYVPASSGVVVTGLGIRFPDGTSQTTAGGGGGGDLARSSSTFFPQTSVPNATDYGVAIATVTMTTRGYPVYISLNTVARGGGVFICTGPLVDGDFVPGLAPNGADPWCASVGMSDGTITNQSLYFRLKLDNIAAGAHSFAVWAVNLAGGTPFVGFDTEGINQITVEEVPE